MVVFFACLTQGTVNAQSIAPPDSYGCTAMTDAKGTVINYCALAPIPIPNNSGTYDVTKGVVVFTGFASYLANMIKLFMGIVGVLAVLMIIIGGIEYMSTVSLDEKSGARTRITNALLGLVLALSSYVILFTINPALTEFDIHLPGVTITQAVANSVAGSGIIPPPPAGSGKTSQQLLKGKDMKTYDAMLKAAAANTKPPIDCTWAKALMAQESGYDATQTSPAGAMGLMQVMPGTYGQFGKGNPYDPQNNINAGTAVLAWCTQHACDHAQGTDCKTSDMAYVLACYNAGNGSNEPSVDCPGQTQWECPIKRGDLQQTYDYVDIVRNNHTVLAGSTNGC